MDTINTDKDFKHGRNGYSKHHCRCDVCRNEQAAYKKAYRIANPEKCREYDKKTRLADPEQFRAHARERYRKNSMELERKRAYKNANLCKWKKYSQEYHAANREREASYHKEQRAANPEKFRLRTQRWRGLHRDSFREWSKEYQRKRRKDDPIFRLHSNLRRRISRALGRGNKDKHTAELIGCSIAELRKHLESQFKLGMAWNNYGEWHIDHIKPCSSFDLTASEQQKICFNWKNLQPLWARENLIKSDKVA